MNVDNFYKYIKNPQLLKADNIAEIQSVLEAYPYFQSVHFLYLKALYQQNNFRFNDQLKKSVVYINNRKKLLYFLKEEYAFLQAPKETINIDIKEKTLKKEENRENTNTTKTFVIKNNKKKKEILKTIEKTEKPKTKESINKEGKPKIENQKNSKASEILQNRLKELQEKSKTSTKATNIPIKKVEKKTQTAPPKLEKSDILPTEILDWIQVTPPSDYLAKTEKLHSLQESEEKLTFKEWVAKLNTVFEEREKREAKKPKYTAQKKPKKQDKIINRFLENKEDKSIRINKNTENNINQSFIEEESDDSSFMTETLANIYIKQAYYDKAIEGYQRLILKYPKKNGYFASRIKEIEQLKQNL